MYSFLFKNRLVKIVFNLLFMKSIFKSVIDVVFPPVCTGCYEVLADHEYLICSYCRFEMPKTNFLFHADNEALHKFYGIVPIQKVASLLYFEKEGITQHILHHLKYKSQPELGILLANMFEDDISKSNFFDSDACLIPIPLHPKRLKERGYNQVHLFTKTLANNHNISFDDDLLIRTVYKKTQTNKNLEQRNASFDSVFKLNKTISESQNLVLIDDVLTTGSTLIQSIKTLQQLPYVNISVLTIAYAHS
jgi:ComF family protein